MFIHFVPLIASYFSGFTSILIPCIALGILCASPYLVRKVIDYV